MKKNWLTIVALVCLLLGQVAVAENSTRTGGYTIHHNAVTTDGLPSQVATAYRIQRSKNRALLNVSIIKDQPGSLGTPVRADIRAASRNLFGQLRQIEMREVIDGDAIYYLADFPVAHREILTFDLEIMPEGGRFPLRATMRQEFWTD